MGIRLQRDGKLQIESAALDAALASDLEAVASFFTGASGFADSLRRAADAFVDPLDGAITRRITQTNERVSELKDDISEAESRLETFEVNLVRQFSALERAVSELQQQASFLTSYLLGQSR